MTIGYRKRSLHQVHLRKADKIVPTCSSLGDNTTKGPKRHGQLSANNPVAGDVAYYGVLTDIIELSYFGGQKVVLFKCDWMSEGKNKRPNEHGFTLANFAQLTHANEPFVLASQVQQVFYVEDPVDEGWHVVIRTTARDTFNMNTEFCVDETNLQSESCDGQFQDE
ncbi:hypothetical protein Vadar_022986 [Vaccinium darrowii]|uniref:Uncharacterized protein n=1 Tax=Vaccinium darrowii TaxID=229202 RepID=A0ACB7YGK1_9ERIC|nr:hypothetical protein Vadar_022986 [Vaccinium darrowii]